MPKTSIGPEARLIQLFDLLPDESKRIVRDILNAKLAAPKTQEAKAQSTRKKGLPPTVENGSKPVKDPKCDVCYEVKDHGNHDMTYLSSHEFVPPKSASRKRKPKDAPSDLTGLGAQSENTSALAVGAD